MRHGRCPCHPVRGKRGRPAECMCRDDSFSWISPRKKTTGMGARESGCAGMPGPQPALLDTRDCPERVRPRAGRACPWVFGVLPAFPEVCRSCRAIIPGAREGPCAPKGVAGMGELPAPRSSVCWCLCCWKEGLDPPSFTAGGAESGNPGWPGRILAESFRSAE